jgi:hypothetical protein
MPWPYTYLVIVLLLIGVSYVAAIVGLYFPNAGLGSAVAKSASTAITGSYAAGMRDRGDVVPCFLMREMGECKAREPVSRNG